MPRIFSSPARRDGIVLAALGLAIWMAALRFDLMDGLFDFVSDHEEYELDEFVLALLLTGFFGFAYAWRRNRELRAEVLLRHQAEADSSWLAFHDILTRLPNRRYLDQFYADVARNPGRGYDVFVVDLDGFKRVNDLVGHDGGNELLVEIAQRLQTVFPDDLVLRMGGDEFAAFAVPRIGVDAVARGATIAEAVSRPCEIGGVRVQVGACIGIADYPRDSRRIAEVTHFADVAMYEAKRRGRNAVARFDRRMADDLAQRAEAEAQLRSAIALGEIVPHYQPLIDLANGRIRGFEALARWRRGDGTQVPPDVFIALAEDAGLITVLSEQLLRQACRDALGWPAETVLAFNISPTQLTDKLLGLRIVQILGEVGLPARRLEIEITESALVRDIDAAAAVIESLHAAGISVALDDFGTGYSSLGQLSRLRFDKVKIDRSFVASFEGDDRQEKIIRAIIGLGHGLGIVTTAEGVEDPSQSDRLRRMGCDFGQGFLYGKAMPAEDARRLLAESEPRRVVGA